MAAKPTPSIDVDQLLSSDTPDKLIAPLSFEQGSQLLEQLVSSVEQGTLPLEQAVRAYERGVLVVKRLRTILGDAETRLKVIDGSTGKEIDNEDDRKGGR